MSRVALISENSVEYVDKLLDIWNSGDSAVLLDWRIPFQPAIPMMREAEVTDCFIEKKLLDKSALDDTGDITFIVYEIADISPKLLFDKA